MRGKLTQQSQASQDFTELYRALRTVNALRQVALAMPFVEPHRVRGHAERAIHVRFPGISDVNELASFYA